MRGGGQGAVHQQHVEGSEMASPMRISEAALSIRVVVHRIKTGAAPFRWEIHGDAPEPIYASPAEFTGIDAAFRAGQARLAEFMPKRSMAPGDTENRRWHARRFGADGRVASING